MCMSGLNRGMDFLSSCSRDRQWTYRPKRYQFIALHHTFWQSAFAVFLTSAQWERQSLAIIRDNGENAITWTLLIGRHDLFVPITVMCYCTVPDIGFTLIQY
eukprot:GFKZ01010942.1.p2 GENE.GFKZ01010942.1~~GFKZ01010942.1.p2  ORF type:complete len:102 (-),score=2.87 GFKZ01010942.1:84-389(-)